MNPPTNKKQNIFPITPAAVVCITATFFKQPVHVSAKSAVFKHSILHLHWGPGTYFGIVDVISAGIENKKNTALRIPGKLELLRNANKSGHNIHITWN